MRPGEGVQAVRQRQFDPGRKDGNAVRVPNTLEMTLTLR